MTKGHLPVVTIGLFIILGVLAQAADIRFSRHYSDNMVLQREKPVLIRGFANKGAKVTVAFGDQRKEAMADDNGVWSVTLDPMPTNPKGQELTATSSIKNQKSKIENVVVGDVFLFARQTNIDVSLGRDATGKEAVTDLPSVRVMMIKTIPAATPQQDLAQDATDGWQVLDKDAALKMNAAAFYVARDLAPKSDAPIGIIDLNMGHHFPIAWMSKEALAETETVFGEKAKNVNQTVKRMEESLADFKDKEALEEKNAKRPYPVENPVESPLFPAAGYNAVLHPLRGLALKGLLLQLGNDYPYVIYEKLVREGKNTDRRSLSQAYKDSYRLRKWCLYLEPVTTPRIPREWRKVLDDESLPVGWITPPGSDLVTMGRHHREMRELQRQVTFKEPDVDLILSGTEHIPFSAQPMDDALLGSRCVAWLNGAVYKKAGAVATGPRFDRAVMDYSKAQVFFKEGTAQGLTATPGALDYFEVAGVDLKFHPAKATLDGETVRLSSDTVPRIAYIRYNWAERPNQGLTNGAGLPAIPFVTSDHQYPATIDTLGEEVLPEEFSLPIPEWKGTGAVIVNGRLNKAINGGNGKSLGPTGLRVNPTGPNLYVCYAFVGSPADGKIHPGDYLYSVNGKLFGEEYTGGKLYPKNDDRFAEVMYHQIADAITQAETEEGKGLISFGVLRDGKTMTVELKLEVLGTYSSTFPYDCPKTDRIVANAEAFLSKRGGVMPGKHTTFTNADALFLLAAGTPEYQGLVRRHIYNRMARWDGAPVDPLGKESWGSWTHAADALLAGEYYLATGDTNVLPFMKFCCDSLNVIQARFSDEPVSWPTAVSPGQVGSWRHNFYGNKAYPSMPAIGVPATLGYHLIKEAGVKYDFGGYQRAVNWFLYNGAKVGKVQYGFSDKPVTQTDPIDHEVLMNGKFYPGNGCVGGAAALFQLRKNYPVARTCSFVATYSYNNTSYAHGGHFWTNWLTPLGPKVQGKKTFQFFMKKNRWYQENHRMFNHCKDQGNAGMGAGQFLAYVAPRERLRILGAHESVFAENPPEFLKPALDLYRNRNYKACETAVTALLDKGGIYELELKQTQQLKDAAILMQKSVAHDLAKVKSLIAEGKLYEATLDLEQLEGVLPEGNPDLAEFKATLGAPANSEPLAQDKKRYDAYIKSLDEKHLIPAAKAEDENVWKSLVTRVNITRSKDHPDGLLDDANATRWRMKVLESIRVAPDNWTAKDFDDSDWTETTLPMSWHTNHTVILRSPFTIEDKGSVKALRLKHWAFRQQNMRVYINGVLVAKISASGSGGKELKIPLNEHALQALTDGQNVLAATFKHNWRWGRYERNPETLRSSSVYNHGVHLKLEMQEN